MSRGRRFLVIAALQSGCKDIAAALCRGMPLPECRSVTALDELNRALDEGSWDLAIAGADIVAQSGGHVAVESAMGEGTTLRIHLPRADRPAVGIVAKPAQRARGGDESILLVEDEDAVRALASTILRRGGYRVIDATKPVEAEQIFTGLDRGIDLLVTDMTMPGGTGTALYATLLAKQPGLRVVFMSGYPGGISIDGNPAAGFLEKPFTADRLMRAVREVLDR